MMTTATQSQDVSQPQTADPALELILRREKGGPELKRVSVPSSVLNDIHSELWRDNGLRKAMPEVTLEAMKNRLTPEYAGEESGGSICQGLLAESINPRGEKLSRQYPVSSFADVATQAVQDLVKEGVLHQYDPYTYELIVDDQPHHAPDLQTGSFSVTSKSAPFRFLKRSLKPLLDRARTVGELIDGEFPVIYTEQAFAKAERFARLGAQSHPARETGSVLLGPVCSCPDTGELYLVICDALELTAAEESKFALLYTGKTWTRIKAVVSAMQTQPRTQAFRILGQSHGHNFIPNEGAPPCEMCSKVETCGRTSVHVSIDDRLWTQAVFTRQPWAVCHIFGLNAREDQVHGLYSLRDNCLLERGFHVIDDFDPEEA